MNRKELARLVLASLAGTISEKDGLELERWRAESPGNEMLFRSLTSGGFLDEEYRKTQAIDTARPLEDMKRRIRKAHRNPAWLRWAGYGTAAAAVLAVGIWIGTSYSARQPALISEDTPQTLLAEIEPGCTQATLTTSEGTVFTFHDTKEMEQIPRKKDADRVKINNLEIPRGGEFHVTLEDGTDVWLNAQTTLRYPEVFSETQRSVEIVGEGYFKVRRDPSRPFLVRTAGQVIKVYGTEFNVNSYEDDEEVVTTLVEGSISLSSDLHSSNELMLAPGHQAVFSKASDETTVKTVNTDVVTSWRNDMFVFDDLTLDRIMRQLSRWYDFEYAFDDEESPLIVFKGRIPRYGKFGDTLEILEKSGGLRFEVEGRTVHISVQKQDK